MADANRVAAAEELIALRPGLTYAAAAARLGGRRTVALTALRAAVAAGRLREGATYVATKHGAVRSARGLFVGPPPATDSQSAARIDAAGLRNLRIDAQVSLEAVARPLGVSRSLIHLWETGRQPIPTWAQRELARALEDAQTPRPPSRRDDNKRRRDLLRRIRDTPGITWHALVGRRRTDRAIVEAARRNGQVHEAPSWTARTHQPITGLYPGRRPRPETPPLLTHELRSARLAAGWTHAAIAHRIGVPATTYAGWERKYEAVPVRAAESAAQALTEARRTAAELTADSASQSARVLAVVRANPGLSRKALLPLVYVTRAPQIARALGELLATGALHERHAGRRGQPKGLFVGPMPARALSPQSLRRLRTERGLTQRRVADGVGCGVQTVRYWEDGTRELSLEWQQRLLDYLEGHPETLRAARERLEHQLLERIGPEGRVRSAIHGFGLASREKTDEALAALLARGDVVQCRVATRDSNGVTYRRAGYRSPEKYVEGKTMPMPSPT